MSDGNRAEHAPHTQQTETGTAALKPGDVYGEDKQKLTNDRAFLQWNIQLSGNYKLVRISATGMNHIRFGNNKWTICKEQEKEFHRRNTMVRTHKKALNHKTTDV